MQSIINKNDQSSYVMFFSKSKIEKYRYLSNFSEIDTGLILLPDFPIVKLRNLVFPTVEHAFQASKLCLSDCEPEHLEMILKNKSPNDAKKFGNKTNFKKLKLVLNISEWNKQSVNIMQQILRSRYECDIKFKDLVNDIKEKNMKFLHFDRSGNKSFWGGYFQKSNGNWVGTNKLGELMNKL